MPLVGSRGCGWSRCTFCAERFNWRARTPEKVAEEIENYVARGFKDFVFNESDFNSNPSFVIRLCRDIVRRGIKANFTAQLRIGKDCDFEYYKAMKDAGFTCLRFGVDGLSENTLLLQRKGYTKEMVMQNLKHCHDLGIFTEINVVIGVPGETDADVEESADFIIEMKPYIGRVAFINPLMMFVGSVYYFEPERHQIKFVENKEELYKNYFVSLPDSSWYSENPYIDHNIRRQRFFRIVERIREVGVPLGAFANFTAAFRKDHQEDSHTLSQPKPHTTDIAPGTESATLSTQLEEKTEFQNTFYGSWSGLFLSGNSWRTDEAAPLHDRRVVRLNDEFYYAKETIVRKSEMINFYACPFLLKSYKGYNLVGYRDQILGAPIVLGPIDLTQDDATNDIRILKGQTEDEVASIIDWIHAAVNLANDPPVPQTHRTIAARGALTRRFFDVPTLLRSYKNYNLVGYRDQILGAPLSLGPIDLTQDSARMDDRIIEGQTEDDVTAKIDALNSGDRDAQVGPERNTRSLVSQATGRKVNMGPGVLLRWGN